MAGLFGLIPIIGPLLGAVPGVLVTLASSPGQTIWVALVYVIVQLIENNVITPRIQGRAVRLNPALVMATLLVASEIAGLWGVIVGVPLVAATRDVFIYFYKQWGHWRQRSAPGHRSRRRAKTHTARSRSLNRSPAVAIGLDLCAKAQQPLATLGCA